VSILFLIAFAVSVILQLAILAALSRGAYVRYTTLTVYATGALLLSVLEAAAYVHLDVARVWNRIYWINELILQSLIFFAVVSLIYHALEEDPKRVAKARSYLTASLLAGLLCVVIARDPGRSAHISRWMTDASRNLSFLSAVLTFVLWSALMRHRSRDYQLFMLSGAFGLQTAGKAIAHALRSLGAVGPGNVFLICTYLASLALLAYALWRLGGSRAFPAAAARGKIGGLSP
jgi:hypothetical protein